MDKLNVIIRFLFVVTGMSLLLYSCLDLDTEKAYLGDAYVVSKIVGSDTLYSLESYVSSNTAVAHTSMEFPKGTSSVDLTCVTTGYYEYFNGSDYSRVKPQIGDYSFSITFEDSTVVKTTDQLTDTIAPFITYKGVEPAGVLGCMLFHWEKNARADYYMVKILKDDKVVYSSGNLSDSTLTVHANDNEWISGVTPEDGEEFDVVLFGVVVDNYSSKYTKIQSISQSAIFPFVWKDKNL
ncbi:MAG TPA: hypothetical protein PKH79_05700 [Prolixibacteraceae bacterium]|nr:hypothetical protein [Prolixibacteraceae bacterium]HPS13688.1 hypothetical protein [Prolixibacteraceae bacterium]